MHGFSTTQGLSVNHTCPEVIGRALNNIEQFISSNRHQLKLEYCLGVPGLQLVLVQHVANFLVH